MLRFGNTSRTSCTLTGYPGVDAYANGRTIAHAERTVSGFIGGSHHGVPTVRLAAGKTASAIVEWIQVDSDGKSCAPSLQLRVTAANTTRAVTLDVAVSACRLQVHPTVPGTSGNYR